MHENLYVNLLAVHHYTGPKPILSVKGNNDEVAVAYLILYGLCNQERPLKLNACDTEFNLLAGFH